MARVYLETYGCTLNRADGDIMAAVLRGAGHALSKAERGADVIVLNTCTVKGATENKIMERIRRLGAANKKFVVAGCMACEADRVWRVAPSVPVVWPSALSRLPEAVEAAVSGKRAEFHEAGGVAGKGALPRMYTAPILRVPIGEGCVGNCHFCQTKLARPVLRSHRPDTIMGWVREGVAKGAREVQLTAMDSGVYGMDLGMKDSGLVELMNCINGMEGDFLTRLGMINPEHALTMKDGLARELRGKRFYRFLHIPVQAGSERVVQAMGRRHSVADFEAAVRFFRKKVPGMTIATDIIVGYPGETEGEFRETLALVRRVRPDIVNVSRFSARPGTRAKELKPLPSQTVKERSRQLSALVKKVSTANNKKLIGKEFEVLVTERQKSFTGRAASYRQVVVAGKARLGERVFVRITNANHGALFGEAQCYGKSEAVSLSSHRK